MKISQLPAPVLAGVVYGKNRPGAISAIKNCMFAGADIIDLHLECLDEQTEDAFREIISAAKLPVLALNYISANCDQGWEEFEQQRIEGFLAALRAGAAGIDIQGYTCHRPSRVGFFGEDKYSFTKNAPKEVVTDEATISKQCELIEQVHFMGKEVLLSCHPGIPMNCQQVVDLALFLEKRNPDILKIVTVAENEEDAMESIRTMTVLKKEVKTPVTYHVNGPAGTLSRIINPLLGGHVAFCIDSYKDTNFVEQPDLRGVRAIVDNLRRNL